jgi:hypothetical protein
MSLMTHADILNSNIHSLYEMFKFCNLWVQYKFYVHFVIGMN